MTRSDGPVDPNTPTEAPSSADTVASSTEPRAPLAAGGGAGPSTYQLGDLIGRGGMGEVLLAHDKTIGRDVALKRLRGAPGADVVERFLREAKIQARLDHPAIAPVHELGRDAEGRPFFTMKRVAGTTMMAALDAGSETPQRLLRGLVDVALAVELAHSRRVVHRDLKPSNIMFGDYGEVYVLDWGVARVLADTETGNTAGPDIPSLDGETRVGTLLGTPGYMAPEQARGEPVGPAADVYALGAMLFEVLAGETLHPRGGVGAIASTLDGVDPSPAKRRADRAIPPELDAVCGAALAMDPKLRPSARGFANAIQAYLDGDRDLERRRANAAELVAQSRAALAAGDEALALNAAGRATVFDPSSSDAGQLVVDLLVDTKRPPPPELRARIAADEDRLSRERSRRATIPFLSLFMLIPLVPMMHVLSWPTLGLVYASILMSAVVLWLNTRRRVPTMVTLASNLVVIIMFSRIAGPFVLTPMLVCTILLLGTTLPRFVDRPYQVIAWAGLAALAPLGLEWLGVLGPSWSFGNSGLISTGTIFGSDSMVDRAVLVCGSIAATLVVAVFARVIGRDRRDAERQVYVQLWRLQQLSPRATS